MEEYNSRNGRIMSKIKENDPREKFLEINFS